MATTSSRAVLGYLRFFRSLAGWHVFAFALLVLLTSWTEGLGIALLLPLISGNVTAGTDPLSRAIATVLTAVHLPLDLRGVLAALVLVAVLKATLTFLMVSYQFWLAAKVTQDLRRMLVTGISRSDYRHFTSMNSGTLVNLVYGHTVQTASAFQVFSRLFPHLVTILAFATILAVIDWKLTSIVLIAGAIAASFLRWPARLSQRYSTKSTDEANRFSGLLMQTIYGFKYLAATDALSKLHRKIFSSVRALTVHSYKTGFLAAFAYSLPQPVVALFLAGIMLYQLRSGGAVAAGFVLLVYLYRMMNEMFALQVQWQAFSQLTGPVDTVVDTLAKLDAHREPTGQAAVTGLRDAIEIRDVTFAYEERPVLQNVSVKIPRNRTVAFVGESGSGKTTLMDLVTGLVRPTSGAVLLDGRDLRELDVAAWRSRIGFVPQESVVFEDSVANNISLWSCDATDPACMERIRDAARKAYCDEFVRAMPQGYDSPIGERGFKLSGGQKQRICIARELFKSPEILILDEATSALDSESESFIQRSIEQLKGSLTILVIAHRLSTIKGCDHLYVLEQGRVIEEGSYAELLAREGSRFREMARLQNL